ncbi:MAG: hypothetical protein OEY34_04695 [Cyclobacteriaceae bacterium]|nr:hypothetical protein [Cyclobacteriaceae bacterium]
MVNEKKKTLDYRSQTEKNVQAYEEAFERVNHLLSSDSSLKENNLLRYKIIIKLKGVEV